MSKIRKVLSIAVALLLLLLPLTSCVSGNEEDGGAGDKPLVIAANFPSYDFARGVCGDAAEVRLLLPVGMDSHSFEPSPQDIIAISRCDLFIYTGGESDAWAEQILSSIGGDVETFRLIDCVEVITEELRAGMESDDADEHAHDEHTQDEPSEDEPEEDEHVWTSPKKAAEIVMALIVKMSNIDPTNSKKYLASGTFYAVEISLLDKEFEEFFQTYGKPVLVFGDRFPFLYFAKEYGLEYYAAFPGCFSKTEASASTITFLIERVREENVPVVFYIEFSSGKIADTVAEGTGAATALFHSCHNVTAQSFEKGDTYVSIMRENLETLKKYYS